MTAVITAESADQPEVRAMLAAGDAYYAALYPAESNHLLDVQTLMRPEVTFLVARIEGIARGFGSIVEMGETWGEIKRMYVDPAARGAKLGKHLLAALEDVARAKGWTVLRLETGIRQPEALGLYRRAGYRDIPPFGDYRPDPLSVFMEKKL